MKELLNSLFTMAVGLGILLSLWWSCTAGVVPSGQMERAGRIAVFLDPGVVRHPHRLVIPDDPHDHHEPCTSTRRRRSSSGSRTTAEIWSRKDTRLTGRQQPDLGRRRHHRHDGPRPRHRPLRRRHEERESAKALIFLPAAISLAGAGIHLRFVYASPPFKVGPDERCHKSIPGLPPVAVARVIASGLLERGMCGIDPPATAPVSTPSC
jgi:hypothetical protein